MKRLMFLSKSPGKPWVVEHSPSEREAPRSIPSAKGETWQISVLSRRTGDQ